MPRREPVHLTLVPRSSPRSESELSRARTALDAANEGLERDNLLVLRPPLRAATALSSPARTAPRRRTEVFPTESGRVVSIALFRQVHAERNEQPTRLG